MKFLLLADKIASRDFLFLYTVLGGLGVSFKDHYHYRYRLPTSSEYPVERWLIFSIH